MARHLGSTSFPSMGLSSVGEKRSWKLLLSQISVQHMISRVGTEIRMHLEKVDIEVGN